MLVLARDVSSNEIPEIVQDALRELHGGEIRLVEELRELREVEGNAAGISWKSSLSRNGDEWKYLHMHMDMHLHIHMHMHLHMHMDMHLRDA